MRNLLKYILIILLIFSGGMNIALLTKEQNTDKVMLDIAENSHFVGCARITAQFDYCRTLSKQYRKDMKDKVGLDAK